MDLLQSLQSSNTDFFPNWHHITIQYKSIQNIALSVRLVISQMENQNQVFETKEEPCQARIKQYKIWAAN